MSNFPDEVVDKLRGWKPKEVTRKGVTHIELRKSFPGGPGYAQALCCVALAEDGMNYDALNSAEPDRWGRSTKGYSVRLSMNGVAYMQTSDLADLFVVADWAHVQLRNKKKQTDD